MACLEDKRKLYLTYGMVLCLVTLTDLYMRRVGFVSISWASCYPRDATRKRGTCYGNVAGWVAGWVSVTRQYCV